MHCVLDVGGAAVLQLHLLQAALVIRICSETHREKLREDAGLRSTVFLCSGRMDGAIKK